MQTSTLSGRPSGELKEVSPVCVSCPPLRWLPPFPGNSGHSPSTHTHWNPKSSCRTTNTTSHTLSLSLTHTHIPLSVPTPYNNNLNILPFDLIFFLSHKLRKEKQKMASFLWSQPLMCHPCLVFLFLRLADDHRQFQQDNTQKQHTHAHIKWTVCRAVIVLSRGSCWSNFLALFLSAHTLW